MDVLKLTCVDEWKESQLADAFRSWVKHKSESGIPFEELTRLLLTLMHLEPESPSANQVE
jgi:hypothetical protein